MNVLSLFDGMGCGAIALRELGINVDKYYASEIDKFAIMQTNHNFPGIIHLGSVLDVDVSKLDRIDLLIGGSRLVIVSINQFNNMKGKTITLLRFASCYLGVDHRELIFEFIMSDTELSVLDKRIFAKYGLKMDEIDMKYQLCDCLFRLGLAYIYRKRNSSIRRLGKAVDRLVYHVLKCFKLK